METRTYQQTKEIVETEGRWMQVYENLHLNGIPYKDVHYYRYKRPWYSSGFSMGEVIIIRCNGHGIDRIDNTQEYAKSCKWRANHGLVIINFTQKGLRDYIKAAKRGDGFECHDLLEKYLDKDASKISKRK